MERDTISLLWTGELRAGGGLDSLGELESYCDCVDKLSNLLESQGRNIRSRALRRLHGDVQVEQLNNGGPGSGKIATLISLVEDGRGGVGAKDGEDAGCERVINRSREGTDPSSLRRTFKIRPGTPAGQSCAREIAAEHGVSYQQLEELLRKRGVVS